MTAPRPKQSFPMVEVWWDDAAAHENGWSDEVLVGPQMVLSVGFLVYCKKDYVVIAQDIDGDGGHNGRTQIPRAMVRKMKVLRRADGR